MERAKDDEGYGLALADGRTLSYGELLQEVRSKYAKEATLAEFDVAISRSQTALDRLAVAIADARPDLVIIVGDDQGELFPRSCMPALAVFKGEELIMYPRLEVEDALPEWRVLAATGYAMDAAHRFPCERNFATRLIEHLTDDGFDLTAVDAVPSPHERGFGHAYGFVIKRLYGGVAIPTVPLLLNTYFPPNVPTSRRCFQIGKAIAAAVKAIPGGKRVAIVASGGLSHFVTEEDLDRSFINALETADSDFLRAIPREALRSGTSEILNWVVVAGAVQHLQFNLVDYVAVRRTAAGTGIGLGFGIWNAANGI